MCVNELSNWQCLLLCLISIQERTNKHHLSLIQINLIQINLIKIFNTNQLKKQTNQNIFPLKSKKSQVFAIAFPD